MKTLLPCVTAFLAATRRDGQSSRWLASAAKMSFSPSTGFFSAKLLFNDVPRRAAKDVHNDEEDYAVSYDAYFNKVIYEGKGRRSKKREQQLLAEFRDHIDELAQQAGGEVLWEQPLREVRW